MHKTKENTNIRKDPLPYNSADVLTPMKHEAVRPDHFFCSNFLAKQQMVYRNRIYVFTSA